MAADVFNESYIIDALFPPSPSNLVLLGSSCLRDFHLVVAKHIETNL